MINKDEISSFELKKIVGETVFLDRLALSSIRIANWALEQATNLRVGKEMEALNQETREEILTATMCARELKILPDSRDIDIKKLDWLIDIESLMKNVGK